MYAPALAVLDRSGIGLGAADVADIVDDGTAARHALLVELVTQLRARGHAVPSLSVRGHGLVGGPVSYRHERFGQPGRPTGVRLYDRPVEVDDSVRAALGREIDVAEYVSTHLHLAGLE